MNVTFRQLRVFIVVTEHGSMRGAAAALQLTPPAVSLQIKELQKNIGLSLFDRHKRGLSLSPAGQDFLVHAKRLIAELKEAENAIAHYKGLDRGMLTIGMQRTAEYFVPRLLALFNQNHPGLEVKIRAARSRHQLITFMDAGEVDLCVMARPTNDVPARVERFAANPYVFVCPPKHPLLDNVRVPARALNGYPLIVREQSSGTRIAMERFLLTHKCTPQISMEFESNETIKQSVMAGMGLGFLPLQCIGLELRHGLLGLMPIADTPVIGSWNLVSLPAKTLSPAAEAFRGFVMKQGEKHIRADDANLLSLALNRRSTIGTPGERKSRGGVTRRQI